MCITDDHAWLPSASLDYSSLKSLGAFASSCRDLSSQFLGVWTLKSRQRNDLTIMLSVSSPYFYLLYENWNNLLISTNDTVG